MTKLVPFQATIQDDDTGAAIVSPVVTVRIGGPTGALADLFDIDGVATINPITGGTDGFVQFQARPGKYWIQAADGGTFSSAWYEDFVPESGLAWETFSELASDITAGMSLPGGALMNVGIVTWMVIPLGHVLYGTNPIAALPGLMPVGNTYPEHFAEHTTPGTTPMSDAIEAAAEYGDHVNVHFMPVTYALDRDTYIYGHEPASVFPEPLVLIGAGDGLTIFRPLANSTNALIVQKSVANNVGFVTPTIRDLTISYTGAVAADGGIGLSMSRCLNGNVEVELSGAPNALDLSAMGQTNFRLSVNGTNAAGGLGTQFRLHSDATYRCFGIKMHMMEAHQGEGYDLAFHLQAVDTLNVSDAHFNKARRDVLIDMDGVDKNDVVKQIYFDSIYWDGDVVPTGTPEDSVVIQAPNIGTNAVVDGLYFNNVFWRVGGDAVTSGTVLKVAQGAGDLDGLSRISRIHINNCEMRQFEGRYINLDSQYYDLSGIVSDIKINNNLFNDGPAGSAAANLNAIAIAGKNWSVLGNTFSGAWTDATEAVISVTAEAEDVLISENIFDTTRTDDVVIDLLATNVRSENNLKTGNAGNFPTILTEAGEFFPSIIAAEGTNANGYYREYTDGRLVCMKTESFTAQAITTAFGSRFRSGVLSMGNWAQTFSGAPFVTGPSLNYAGVFATVGAFTADHTATSCAGTFVVTPTSIATSGDFTITVRAEGTAA